MVRPPVYTPLPGVRSILALRPNAIGDFIFALPALHSLRQAYPQASIVLLGRQWHADFLQGRPGPVDEVMVMPPVPGVGAALDAETDTAAAGQFLARVRAAHFDIAIQMYGGGRYSNAYLLSLGARLNIGLRTPDAAMLDRWLPYSVKTNRRLELLQLAALAGAEPLVPQRELCVTANDRREAARCIPPGLDKWIVILHPGASDVRRQWPPAYFAAVADALASKGAVIAISATHSERHLARGIIEHMQHDAIDLSGRLPLSALCGLLERAVMLVANDTGPLHLALAIGTPAVGIFWLTNLLESGPLQPQLLRPALSMRVHCPVCGADNRTQRCAHEVCFVDDVSVEEVSAMALTLYEEAAGLPASPHDRPPRPIAAAPATAPPAPFPRPDPRRSGAAGDRAAPSA